MLDVEVAYCGICGSDVAEYSVGPVAIRPQINRLTGQQPPVTLGHEFSGRIVASGSEVTQFKVGDRIAADACWRCEDCDECRRGRYNLCQFGASIGLASDGAFAKIVRIPAYCAVPLPDEVSDQQGALLEPLAVGLHALDRGQARAGDNAVVLGFGAVGASTSLVARALGLRVIVSEPHDGRRSRAESLGYETINPVEAPRDVAKHVREITQGGVQLAVDCTGVALALDAAHDMVARGGLVVVVGIHKRPVAIDAMKLVLYERGIVGSLGYANDLPRVCSLIANGLLKPESLITRVVTMDAAVSEFDNLASGQSDDIKILVTQD
jgi:(R,R)-butanediol dehydrogenase / meso-butanediol dehydrogenase / diacetyl reductase